jgi:hypothetical protein
MKDNENCNPTFDPEVEAIWNGIVKMEFDYTHRQPEDFETIPDRFVVKSLEHWTVDA